jgi:hypothetical protein
MSFTQSVDDANFWGLVGGGDVAARAFCTATLPWDRVDAVSSKKNSPLFASAPAQSLSITRLTL